MMTPIHFVNRLRGTENTAQDDESVVKAFLLRKEMIATPFSKQELRKKKTPDFRVYDLLGNLVFYCEVKSIVENDWLEKQLEKAPPLAIVGGLRNESAPNKVSNKIHEAAAQFDAVNSDLDVPNVLFFVNHQKRGCDKLDLFSVILGYLPTSRGKFSYNAHISEGRIKNEKHQIHLYVWLENCEAKHYQFSSFDQKKKSFLYEQFKLGQENIRNI